jgi:hypothetical protein
MTGAVSSDDEEDDNESSTSTLVDSDDGEDEFQDSRTTFSGDDSDSGGDGIKMYLQKDGQCFGLQRHGRRGINFTPRPLLAGVHGNGLYLRAGSSIYNGEGLLLGPQSPFKKIPILGWLL